MGQQLFFESYIRGKDFLTETDRCSGGSWWLYLSGKKDIFMTSLLKLIFYVTVVVCRCW